MIRKVLLTVFGGGLVFTVVFLAFIFGKSKGCEEIAHVELAHIRNDLDVWRMLGDADKEVKRRVVLGILGKMVIVSKFNVPVQKLRGTGLESLCMLATTPGQEILLFAEDDAYKKITSLYVAAVQDEVRNRISDSQRILGGKGCDVGVK